MNCGGFIYIEATHIAMCVLSICFDAEAICVHRHCLHVSDKTGNNNVSCCGSDRLKPLTSTDMRLSTVGTSTSQSIKQASRWRLANIAIAIMNHHRLAIYFKMI